MKCFYCGRPLKVMTDDKGYVMAKCVYPRCKLQPETDWEKSMELVEADLLMIKESFRNR